jgi:hypothetical protein
MSLKGKFPAITPVRLVVVGVAVYVATLVGCLFAMSDTSPLNGVEFQFFREAVMVLALGLFPAAAVLTVVAYIRGWTGQAPKSESAKIHAVEDASALKRGKLRA